MGENERGNKGEHGGHAHCTDEGRVRVSLTTGAGVSVLVIVGRATENNKGRRGNGARSLHSTSEGTV